MTQFSFKSTGDEVVAAFADRVKGRAILITGPSPGGIGAETVLSLARGSPRLLILAGRTESKIAPLIREVSDFSSAVKAQFVVLDLSSQESVRAAAADVKSVLQTEGIESLDLIINNGAVMACPFTLTDDGIESQFATNYLGHFLLTNLLLKNGLVTGNGKAAGVRIINLSSSAHHEKKIDLDDVSFQNGREYSPGTSYAQSKMANILYTRALAKKGLTSFSLHPGSIATNLQLHMNAMPGGREAAIKAAKEEAEREGREFKMPVRKNMQQGCSTTLVAALDPSIEPANGTYLEDGDVSPKQPEMDQEQIEKLWVLSEKLVGEKFEF